VKPVIERMMIVVFDVNSGRVKSRVEAPGMINIAFSPDATLYAGNRAGVPASPTWPLPLSTPELAQSELEVCEVATGNVRQRFPVTGFRTWFSPDGNLLYSVKMVWDVRTGDKVRDLTGQKVAAFLDNKSMLQVEPGPQPFTIWPAATVPTSIRLSRLNVTDGTKHNLGVYQPVDFERALEHPAQISHDRLQAVDPQMRLWSVPRK
jgi:hypothetical protein